jgi:pimeloyl-ACP methyl ester carboxylesterase
MPAVPTVGSLAQQESGILGEKRARRLSLPQSCAAKMALGRILLYPPVQFPVSHTASSAYRLAPLFVFAVLIAIAPSISAEDAPPRWCAPEVETSSDGVCYVPAPPATTAAESDGVSSETSAESAPEHSGLEASSPRCLIIFLHSLIRDKTTWQWQQHRMLARAAKTLGVSVVMPRGRLGIGPGRAANVWAWPTSQAMQTEHREGKFDKVFVFGFSNGAYYAASLAFRGRLDVQGYGVFAGGSGSRYHRILGQRTKVRPPVFVGYGTKDPAHGDQKALVRLLSELNWPYRSQSARVGHMVTDSQLASAVRFLRGS